MIDELYDTADKIEIALETTALGTLWSPSQIARKAHLDTSPLLYSTLEWMVQNVFVAAAGNGSWRKYGRRH